MDPSKHHSEGEFAGWVAQLAHRGPDASGIFSEADVRLGHRRLSVLDVSSAADQPFFSRCGRYVTVFNGEIYNFSQLAAQWGIQPRTRSDTEILIEAFARFGIKVVNSFRGMFAFCIYDRQTEELFLCRDQLGIKPLFYHHSGRVFVAASELKVLSGLPAVRSGGVCREGLSQYLSLGYIPAPLTAWSGARKLPPGHWAILRGGQLSIRPYWSPEVPERRIREEEEAVDRASASIVSAVREHLVSDVPVGTFLSGGVDSSLVTAVAQKLAPGRIRTFCVRMEGWSKDESGYARQVAEHLGTEHCELVFSEQEALELLPEMTQVYDEPYADSSAAPTMLLARRAREQVTVALCGDGGDELFLGYNSYLWSRRIAPAWLQPFRRPLSFLFRKLEGRPGRLGEFLDPVAQELQPQQTFAVDQGFFGTRARRALLHPAWPAAGDLPFAYASSSAIDPAERQALFDQAYYLPDDLLTKVDRATMRYGLEARVPLLGTALVELALSLDPELKLKGRTQKYLLKKLLERYLPKHLIYRPKWGFSIPLQRWMMGPLAWMEEEFLSPSLITSVGMVRPEVVQELRLRFRRGEGRLYQKLWLLIVLHKWFVENGLATR